MGDKKESGKTRIKNPGMNPWGQYRKPPSLSEKVQGFKFKEIDGIKHGLPQLPASRPSSPIDIHSHFLRFKLAGEESGTKSPCYSPE